MGGKHKLVGGVQGDIRLVSSHPSRKADAIMGTQQPSWSVR